MSSNETTTPAREGDLNLSSHRLTEDVWTRSDRDHRRQAALPLALGCASALFAARAIAGHRWRGALFAGLGAGAAVWAALNPERAQAIRRRAMLKLEAWSRRDDHVNEASRESFPASDPPAWTPTVGTGLRRQSSTH